MKRILILVMVSFQSIVCFFCFTGCNNNFKLVKSITITTNGESQTFSSSTKPEVVFKENYRYIEKREFDLAPQERKYYNDEFDVSSKISLDDAIKSAKQSTYYAVVENELKGFYYWAYQYTSNGNIYYTKREYEKTECRFVYIKIKNDTTIVIKNASNETTYTVTSYRVTYF